MNVFELIVNVFFNQMLSDWRTPYFGQRYRLTQNLESCLQLQADQTTQMLKSKIIQFNMQKI